MGGLWGIYWVDEPKSGFGTKGGPAVLIARVYKIRKLSSEESTDSKLRQDIFCTKVEGKER